MRISEHDQTRFTIVLPDRDRNELFRLAQANERSAGAEVRLAIRRHLADANQARQPARQKAA